MENIRIALIYNKINEFPGVLKQWKEYEQQRLGINLQIKTYRTKIPVSYRRFGSFTIGGGNTASLYGLEGIKKKLRKNKVVPRFAFHVVIFAYKFKKDSLPEPRGRIAHWTYWKEIYPGTEFIEIAVTDHWVENGEVLRGLTHELRHALTYRGRRAGLPLADYMDLSPVIHDGKLSWIPYYRDDNIFAPHGNRALQNKILLPVMKKIAAQPLLRHLLQEIFSLFPKKKTPTSLRRAVRAIRLQEGWNITSTGYLSNNPGNLLYGPFSQQLGAIGRGVQGVAIFPTMLLGARALETVVRRAKAGRLWGLTPQSSLIDFCKRYPSRAAMKDPMDYATKLAKRLDGTPLNPLRDLF